MGFSVFGLLFNDLNFLGVSLFSSKLPGGYWLLLVGPIFEGLMGGESSRAILVLPNLILRILGMTSGVAAMHAYISDTTEPASQ